LNDLARMPGPIIVSTECKRRALELVDNGWPADLEQEEWCGCVVCAQSIDDYCVGSAAHGYVKLTRFYAGYLGVLTGRYKTDDWYMTSKDKQKGQNKVTGRMYEIDFGCGENTVSPSLSHENFFGCAYIKHKFRLVQTEHLDAATYYQLDDLVLHKPLVKPAGAGFASYWYDFFWRASIEACVHDDKIGTLAWKRKPLLEYGNAVEYVFQPSAEGAVNAIDGVLQFRGTMLVFNCNRFVKYYGKGGILSNVIDSQLREHVGSVCLIAHSVSMNRCHAPPLTQGLEDCRANIRTYFEQVIRTFPSLYWTWERQALLQIHDDLHLDEEDLDDEQLESREQAERAIMMSHEQLFPSKTTVYLSNVERILFDQSLFDCALCVDATTANRRLKIEATPTGTSYYASYTDSEAAVDMRSAEMMQLSHAHISGTNAHWNRDYITRMYATSRITDERAGGVYSTLGSRAHTKCFARSLYCGLEDENDPSHPNYMFKARAITDVATSVHSVKATELKDAIRQDDTTKVTQSRDGLVKADDTADEDSEAVTIYRKSQSLCVLQSYYCPQPYDDPADASANPKQVFRLRIGDWCNLYQSNTHWVFVASNEFGVANDYAENLRAVAKVALDTDLIDVTEVTPEMMLTWPFGTFSKQQHTRLRLYTTRCDLIVHGALREDNACVGPAIVEYKTRMEATYTKKVFTSDGEHRRQLVLNYWLYYFCTGLLPISAYIVYASRRCRKRDVLNLMRVLDIEDSVIAELNTSLPEDRGYVGSASRLKLTDVQDHKVLPAAGTVRQINHFALQPLGLSGGSSYADDHFLVPDMHALLASLGFAHGKQLTKRANGRQTLRDDDLNNHEIHKVFAQTMASCKFHYMLMKAIEIPSLGVSPTLQRIFDSRDQTMTLRLHRKAVCVVNSAAADGVEPYPVVWPQHRNRAFAAADNSTDAAIRAQADRVERDWLSSKCSAASYFYESKANAMLWPGTPGFMLPKFRRCTQCHRIRRVVPGAAVAAGWRCGMAGTVGEYTNCNRQQEPFHQDVEESVGKCFSSYVRCLMCRRGHAGGLGTEPVSTHPSVYAATQENPPAAGNVQYAPLLFDPQTQLPLLYCNVERKLRLIIIGVDEDASDWEDQPDHPGPGNGRMVTYLAHRAPIFRPECADQLQFDMRRWLPFSDPQNVNHDERTGLNAAVELSTRYICGRLEDYCRKHFRTTLQSFVNVEEMYMCTTDKIFRRNLAPNGPKHLEFDPYFDSALYQECPRCGLCHNPLFQCVPQQEDRRQPSVPHAMVPKLRLGSRQQYYKTPSKLPLMYQQAVRRCVNRMINTRLLRASLLMMGVAPGGHYMYTNPKLAQWAQAEQQAQQQVMSSVSTFDTSEADFWSHTPKDPDSCQFSNVDKFPHCSQRVFWTKAALTAFGHSSPHLMCTVEDHILEDLESAIDELWSRQTSVRRLRSTNTTATA